MPSLHVMMDFLTAAKSDIDSSESYKLDDFEDKTLTFLGKTYNIVKARGNAGEKVTLTLMSGSEKIPYWKENQNLTA